MSDTLDKDALIRRLRINDSELWSILDTFAQMPARQRRAILRPHSDAGFSSETEEQSMALRDSLDRALGALTLIEIGCELGLIAASDLTMIQGGSLGRLCHSDSFLRYLEAYMYFGVRLLAGRLFPPAWWGDGHQSRIRPSKFNLRSLQLAVPPAVGNADVNGIAFEQFLDIVESDTRAASPDGSPTVPVALGFLDGFYSSNLKHGPGDCDEPAELELWLRGLGPEIDAEHSARFRAIQAGLASWARSHGDFYLALEASKAVGTNVSVSNASDRPAGGWIVTEPTSARFALADFYWIARILRAEVSVGARVSYAQTSWMHLLRFKSVLEGNSEFSDSLHGYEEVIRSVFDFVCDLVQNAVELTEERERQFFQSRDYPECRRGTMQWREVFDDELAEIDSQRSDRTFRPPKMRARSSRQQGADGSGSGMSGGATKGWSEKICTGSEPRNLVGVALSGGGIRSATFNLGVLQGLQELDLLRHVDYLSTVSGGGYIGSWLAANVKRTKHWLGKGSSWDESIAHLRAYSNYLAPRTGFMSPDTWTIAASWIRNAFLIQLTVFTWFGALLLVPILALRLFHALANSFPQSGIKIGQIAPTILGKCISIASATSYVGLLSAVLAVVVTWGLAYNFLDNRVVTGRNSPSASFVRWSTVVPSWVGALVVASMFYAAVTSPRDTCSQHVDFTSYSSILSQAFGVFPFLFLFHWVALIVIGWIVLTPERVSGSEKDLARYGKGLLPAILTGAACMAALYFQICAILYLFAAWSSSPDRFCAYAFLFGPPLILTAFTISVVLFIGFTGRGTNEAQREWWTRFGAWLSLYSAGTLALVCAAVVGPWLILQVPNGMAAIKWSAVAGWVGTVIGGLLAGKSSKTGGDLKNGTAPYLQVLAKLGGLLFIVGLALVSSTVLYLFLTHFALPPSASNVSLSSDPLAYWESLQKMDFWKLFEVLALTSISGLVFSWFFEINIFGLNQFYRNRLVRCYLGATRWMPGMRCAHPFTKFDFEDDMPLSDLRGDYPGPFPILNCALNLAGSADLALNTRHSASFSLTPLHCGADRPKVGYARTGPSHPNTDSFAGGIKLGQAVSISGAAASPNMGYNTSPLVAFLLTMFNVRLGWWFPNPGQSAWKERGLRVSIYYLTRELFGSADENRLFLNVSDGGHFENLGVYELIRRRCKVIIASDAECDECLHFGSLGNLIRICETDFGATIDIDVKSIRPLKENLSLAHCSVGKIKYDNGSLGYLIYLKASISGDEEVGIAQYKAAHPTFPHETTANQFFTEDQFESYRKLGSHVIQHSFRGTRDGDTPLEVAERLGDVLAPAGCPSNAFLKHSETLGKLWGQFRKTPALHSLLDELMMIRPPVAPPLDAAELSVQSSQEHAMALELIQLMEDVFMDLRLDDFWEHPDNRGWAILFMRWARCPKFQAIWKLTHRTFGIRFEYFCAARLGLTRDNPIARV
jgi:hypothetical protein